MYDNKKTTDDLIQLGVYFGQILDLDVLIECVLAEAMKLAQADAGHIYISDDKQLCLSCTQNSTLQAKLSKNEKLVSYNLSLELSEDHIPGYVALNRQTLNTPDVHKLSPKSKYHFRQVFDENTSYLTQSMLTLPFTAPGEKVLGVIQLINKTVDSKVVPFDVADEKLMQDLCLIATISIKRAQATRENLLRMIQMAELHDPRETMDHARCVGGYTVAIYERWARNHNVPEVEILKYKDTLHMAGILHDVGKIGIPDKLLAKEGKLTPKEYDVMKTHTTIGAKLFQNGESIFDKTVTDIVLNHHERWDGTGYPGVPTGKTVDGQPEYRGKLKEEAPLSSRICAIADVFDALISTRVYKKAWNKGRVMEYFKNASGTQFDPELIEVFFSIIDEIFSIQQKYSK